MGGSCGRYGLSGSQLQPPGCPPRCPTELPRSSSVVLSGLAGQAHAIGMTRDAAALVFLPCGAASFLAGRSVPMCWDCGAGSLDGLDIPSSAPRWPLLVPGRPVPARSREQSGVTKCASFTQVSQACLLRCLFGDAQRQALALASHASRAPLGSLLRPSWEAGSILGSWGTPGNHQEFSK